MNASDSLPVRDPPRGAQQRHGSPDRRNLRCIRASSAGVEMRGGPDQIAVRAIPSLLLAAKEGQQVVVELLLVCGGQAVRRTGVVGLLGAGDETGRFVG